jgi:hypothetical protein
MPAAIADGGKKNFAAYKSSPLVFDEIQSLK